MMTEFTRSGWTNFNIVNAPLKNLAVNVYS